MSIVPVSRLEQAIDLAEMSHNVSLDGIRAAIEQYVAEAVARERVTVLDEVLRGLRSERDTDQLRAIIAEVEAIRAAAEIGRQMEGPT